MGVLAGRLGHVPNIFSCRRDLGFWYTPGLLLFLRSINSLTDRIIVNSKAVEQSVIDKEFANPKKIFIIPNGIDIDKFEYSEKERKTFRSELGLISDKICVGMITNMSRRIKRVDLFIDAANYILRKERGFQFLVLGDGKYKNELVGRARRLKLGENMTFIGRDVSKHKILSVMEIGVLSSDSEGFSNAIMEYMAAGLPVIATAVGGNLDLVKEGKTGFLTTPGDAQELGEKIILLGKNKKMCREFGERGRRFIARHNWSTIIDETIAFYQKQI